MIVVVSVAIDGIDRMNGRRMQNTLSGAFILLRERGDPPANDSDHRSIEAKSALCYSFRSLKTGDYVKDYIQAIFIVCRIKPI